MKYLKKTLKILGILIALLIFCIFCIIFYWFNMYKLGNNLAFTNHSQDTVCVLYLNNCINGEIPEYMPFSIDKDENDSTKRCVHDINLIPPDTTDILSLGHRVPYQWEKEAKASKDHKLHFVVFKTSTILNNSWRDIKMKNIYDKRYTLSMDSLEKMNWTITYP